MSDTATVKRETIELPAGLAVKAAKEELPTPEFKGRQAAPNPFVDAIAAGKADRTLNQRIDGITTRKVAQKVISLLRSAAKSDGVSVKAAWMAAPGKPVAKDADTQAKGYVLFCVIDLVTRNRNKSDATA